MPNTIRIVATLTAKEGKADDLKELLAGLVEPTRDETGNLDYVLMQNEENPNEFCFVEKWANADCFEAHFNSEHIKAASALLSDYLAEEVDMRRFQLVT